MKVEPDPAVPYRVRLIPAWRFPQSLRILSFMRHSALAVRSERFDIVHGVGWSLAMNVFNPHGGVEQAYLRQEFRSMSSRAYLLFRYLKRALSVQHHLKLWIQRRQYLSPGVKKIIAISRMIKDDILRQYEVPEEKIAVVFNATDLERFHPRNRKTHREAMRKALGIPDETRVLLFVGNNYRLKGLEPLLRGLVLLKEWFPGQSLRLLVLGRGQTERYLRKARRLGVSSLVLFVGPVEGIERYYAASDVHVHPTFYDSCSLTVLEALASGLPVVTSRFNGAAEVIRAEEGGKVLEDPADPVGLARAIAYYFDDGRLDRARAVTREWMERYPFRYNVEETLRVYYEVIEGAGN